MKNFKTNFAVPITWFLFAMMFAHGLIESYLSNRSNQIIDIGMVIICLVLLVVFYILKGGF